jgi:serine/threonine-protein phosphatase 2A regulatory subunit B'
MPPRSSVRKVISQKETGGKLGKAGKGSAAGSKAKGNENANQILKNRPTFQQPKAEMNQDIGLQRSIPSVYSTGDYGQIEELPPLSSVSEDKFNEMLRQKLQQCRIVCNFADPMADLKSKALKQTYLQEILEHISQPRYYRLMEPETHGMLFTMIKANVIRSLPPIPDLAKVPMIGDDINDTIYESAWPHLELIYQIFLRFLESTLLEPASVEQYVDSSFIAKFLLLFNASDARERDSLKMVLHRLYLKFVSKRQLIRQAIQHIFYTYIYETRYFSGINELLEIMISIINGYAIPLKQEHKDFLIRIILPLHTSNFLHTFRTNLFFCVQQYIKKDAELIPIIVRELLKLWPVSCSLKELIFISELSEIFNSMSDEQFKDLMFDLFHRVGLCITSDNFQVSEAGMLLWKSDRFIKCIKTNAKDLYPIICPFLYKTGTNHWNTPIKNLAVSVIRICMEIAPDVFEAFSRTMKAQAQEEQKKLNLDKETWAMVINNAQLQDKNINVEEELKNLDDVFSKFT